MRRGKKKVVKLMWMLSLLIALTMAGSMAVQAASAKSNAMKAYKNMLSKTTVYKEGWPMKASNCYFAIAYIDNDSVPELVVFNNRDIPHVGGYGMIYTWRNGKVVYAGGMVLDNKGEAGYYKKKGIYTDIYSHQGRKGVSYQRLKKGTSSCVLYKEYVIKGKSWKLSGYKKITGNKANVISKKSFDKSLKSYVGSTKLTKYKFYKNTAGNRKKYLK